MQKSKKDKFTEYIAELIYGGNDGIITTFAVVGGFIGANITENTTHISITAVLLFGLANLFADSTSMGLGNFLSIRSEQESYKSKEVKVIKDIEENKEDKTKQTHMFLKENDFTDEDARNLVKIFKNNHSFWAKFILTEQMELSSIENETAWKKGLATFLSFVFFGSIPLIPFIVSDDKNVTSVLSVIFSFFALILLGVLRWKVTKESFKNSVLEVVFVGIISAVIAFSIGFLFRE